MENTFYPSKLLNSFDSHAGFKRWREQGSEMVGRLVTETKRRNLRCSCHHRISELDLSSDGQGAAWKDDDQPRGFLTADLHTRGMTVTLHAVGQKDRTDHVLAWRVA